MKKFTKAQQVGIVGMMRGIKFQVWECFYPLFFVYLKVKQS